MSITGTHTSTVQFKQSSCYVSDFRPKFCPIDSPFFPPFFLARPLHSSCLRLSERERKRPLECVCWATNLFFNTQILFVYRFVYFLPYPTKLFENRHGNRLEDLCLCQRFPVDNRRKSYTPFPNLRLCNLGTFFFIISFGQMSRGYPIALSHCCLFLSFDFFSGWECWCNTTQDWNDKERIISTYILWLCVASRRSNSVDSVRLFHQRFHQLFGDF